MKNPPILQEEAQRWTRRYEQLREQVLARDTLIGTDSLGLSLLIGQGVAAWMRAWRDPLSCGRAAELEACAPPRFFVGTGQVQRRIISWELARGVRRNLTRGQL